MITIFPKAYNNELLYSWMARYTFINGNIKDSYDKEDLFGNPKWTFDLFRQNNLEYFVNCFPKQLGYTTENIIYRNTIFPVFFKFMDNERKNNIIKKICSSNLSTFIKEIGINIINSTEVRNYINICPLCYEEDKEIHNDAYIHRNYQVPGCYMCAKHNVFLKKYYIKGNDTYGNYKDIKFIDINNIDSSSLEEYDLLNEDKELYLYVSKCIDNIFNGVLNDDIVAIREKYQSKLYEKGYIVNTKLALKKLCNDFNSYYSKEFLDSFDSYIYNSKDILWMRYLVSNKDCKVHVTHPIRHILFIIFLFGTLEDFILYEAKNFRDFGKGPWICLNSLCKDYKKTVITDTKIVRRNKKITAQFKCPTCGFKYCRDTENIDSIRAIIDRGWVWRQELKKLYKKNLSLAEMSRRLSCEVRCVKNNIKKLGLDGESTKEDKRKKSVDKDKLIQYKKSILKFIEDNPNCSRKNLYDKLPNEMRYTKLHDNKWFEKSIPDIMTSAQKIDWERRDIEIAKKVEKTIEKILSENLPIRLTKTGVLKSIDMTHLSYKRYEDRIPLTTKIIQDNYETKKQFIIRMDSGYILKKK
ncbi:TnsD family transposase [Clostridium bornimense]|uniref:TnsD family Tn7-like transposition protein n=1 Tax=Clostridium bornimense TaxID=1216932 RepID=UPI001C121178|nr:TnsD family Tn7-like transposition protein [Clostridium bornimense]MBU5317650.1 TnsD family transposase [Clostridium bornimense]